MNKKKFGEELKKQRLAGSLSAGELGELLKVGVKQIQRYENGEALPTHENIELLCKTYSYDFISLIYDVPRETPEHKKSGINDPDLSEKNKIIDLLEEQKADLKKENARLEATLSVSLEKIQTLSESNQALLMTLKYAASRMLLNQEGILKKLTKEEQEKLHKVVDTLDNVTGAHLDRITKKDNPLHDGGTTGKR